MTDPEQSEQQLRSVLGTMNDLQPPTDELFVQRAVIRGRARTSRRRNGVMGAAAALVLVAGGGGIWLLQDGLEMPTSSSAGSAAEGATPLYSPGVDARSDDTPPPEAPLVPPQRAPSWFVGPMTPQRSAIDSLAPTLTTTWAATFSGVYAADPSNTSVVVALTRRDAALEALVTGAMPAPDDVDFVVVQHSYADKAALVDRIWAESAALQRDGILIVSVDQDFKADRVVVAAAGADVVDRLTSRYGPDWVTVTAVPKGPEGAPSTIQR
jgi:hypothetical protein